MEHQVIYWQWQNLLATTLSTKQIVGFLTSGLPEQKSDMHGAGAAQSTYWLYPPAV
jgi:hypothetical protein